MTEHRTAWRLRVTEHYKARVRLVLLTLVGLICTPLAGVRSAAVWIFYFAFVIAYSLWSLRLTRTFSGDRRLGYLLCLTDTVILLPLLVWTSATSMRAILVAICVCGLAATYWADRSARRTDARSDESQLLQPDTQLDGRKGEAMETSLERALRVRLRVLDETQTRFALVVLRIIRFDEMSSYYGEDASHHLVSAVVRRGLRPVGADAQHFVLPGGRVAFVFSTGPGSTHGAGSEDGTLGWIDPYDLESFAMALGRKACEHLVDGHRVECAVGWASAPADGVNAEDLMYAAESGAQSAAAFRRVAGSRVPVPEKTRVAAG
jgi:hypothetical protein